MRPQNKTKINAFDRVSNARIGSMVDVTDEYLIALRVYASQWVNGIDRVLARRSAISDEEEM